MEIRPKVEIFLTVYDRTEFLARSIASVLSQTRRDFLLTILDDGNNPKIAELLTEYISPRVRHHVNIKCIGVAASLFAAIERSRADFFAILNDDDYWHPDFLERLLAPLEQDSTLPLSFCDHWLVDTLSQPLVNETDENTLRYGRAYLAPGVVSDLAGLVLEKNAVPMAMGSVVRRSAVPKRFLLKAAGRHYDYWLSLVISSRFSKAYYVPERLSYYRIHPAMESSSNSPERFYPMIYMYIYTLVIGIHKKYRSIIISNLLRTLLRAAIAKATSRNI